MAFILSFSATAITSGDLVIFVCYPVIGNMFYPHAFFISIFFVTKSRKIAKWVRSYNNFCRHIPAGIHSVAIGDRAMWLCLVKNHNRQRGACLLEVICAFIVVKRAILFSNCVLCFGLLDSSVVRRCKTIQESSTLTNSAIQSC